MEPPQVLPQMVQSVRRREVLKAGLVAGAALSTWSLPGAPCCHLQKWCSLAILSYRPIELVFW